MLSGTTQITRQAAPLGFARNGAASTKRLEASGAKRLPSGRHVERGRYSTAIQAGLLDTLFSGGTSQVKGSAKTEANELVSEMMARWKSRGNKPLIGPNRRIDEIVEKLQSMNVTKNPARSPLLQGTYRAAYLSRWTVPPFALNPGIKFSRGGQVEQFFDVRELLSAPTARKRLGTMKKIQSNAFTLASNLILREKGGGEVEKEENYAEIFFEILHLDDRVLIVRASRDAKEGEGDFVPAIEIFEKVDPSTNGPVVTGKGTKSNISVGGITKSPSKKAAPDRMAAMKKAEAEREAARAKAARQKAEIQASLDGFAKRLKDAQAQRKEAIATMKAIERDNSGILKESAAFEKQMTTFGDEIAGLVSEVESLVKKQKADAEELEGCRFKLADLRQKRAMM